MKGSLRIVAAVLLGILACAVILMTIGWRETKTNPSVSSYRPSGLSAFAELLRTSGYRIVVASESELRPESADLVIAPIDESKTEEIDSDSRGAARILYRFANAGGKLLVLPFKSDFSSGSDDVREQTATNEVSGKSLRVSARTPASDLFDTYDEPDIMRQGKPEIALWTSPSGSLADLSLVGKGAMLQARDGYVATNRFIDRSDNGTFLLNLVRTLAPPGSRIVFAPNAYTGIEPTLLDALGPAAALAWYQTLFLFLVVVFSLGRRFGLPEEPSRTQSGQRDLVNAIADTFQRAKQTRTACRAAHDRADAKVRKALKLGSDSPIAERDAHLPDDLARAFRQVFEGTIDPLSSSEAFARCRILEQRVSEFLYRP